MAIRLPLSCSDMFTYQLHSMPQPTYLILYRKRVVVRDELASRWIDANLELLRKRRLLRISRIVCPDDLVSSG